MSSRPPSICRCGGLVQNRICTGCGPRKPRTGWQPDSRRGTRHERGYDNTWLATRIRKLNKSPLCELCELRGMSVDAVEVHHIEPFNGLGDPLRLSIDNLQSLCIECHGRITRSRSASTRNGGHP